MKIPLLSQSAPSGGKTSSFILDPSAQPPIPLQSSLQPNMDALKKAYNDCDDVVFHECLVFGRARALLIYIDGLVNVDLIDKNILEPLIQNHFEIQIQFRSVVKQIPISQYKEVKSLGDIIANVSSGSPVLLVDGLEQGIAFSLPKWEKRSITEPISESVVRGPREGFTETLSVNVSMLRRKVKSPAMKTKPISVGDVTQTKIIVTYIEGIAEQQIVDEAVRRLQNIKVLGVLESANLEEAIEDHKYTPFPQIQSTERPDVVVSALLDGRVGILVDGTPFALIIPVTLPVLLQSAEDYYERFMIATAIRWLRYFFFLIALLAPSAYVAVLTYHQEMIPTSLVLSIAKSREEIPFPALAEALFMEIAFEALREAGVRLPKQVGSAVSIVGALVIGQAATTAGLVSYPMVMVVAITGIASFMIPQYAIGISLRLLRFPIMFLSGMLGLLGLVLGLIMVVSHLANLQSFGVPYLSPLTPTKMKDFKDVLWRAPWTKMDATAETFANPQGQKG